MLTFQQHRSRDVGLLHSDSTFHSCASNKRKIFQEYQLQPDSTIDIPPAVSLLSQVLNSRQRLSNMNERIVERFSRTDFEFGFRNRWIASFAHVFSNINMKKYVRHTKYMRYLRHFLDVDVILSSQSINQSMTLFPLLNTGATKF